MNDMPTSVGIAANLNIEGGAYFRIRLFAIPRVGEDIDFYPLESAGPARQRYIVVRVEHEIHAVIRDTEQGHHFVTVHVRQA